MSITLHFPGGSITKVVHIRLSEGNSKLWKVVCLSVLAHAMNWMHGWISSDVIVSVLSTAPACRCLRQRLPVEFQTPKRRDGGPSTPKRPGTCCKTKSPKAARTEKVTARINPPNLPPAFEFTLALAIYVRLPEVGRTVCNQLVGLFFLCVFFSCRSPRELHFNTCCVCRICFAANLLQPRELFVVFCFFLTLHEFIPPSRACFDWCLACAPRCFNSLRGCKNKNLIFFPFLSSQCFASAAYCPLSLVAVVLLVLCSTETAKPLEILSVIVGVSLWYCVLATEVSSQLQFLHASLFAQYFPCIIGLTGNSTCFGFFFSFLSLSHIHRADIFLHPRHQRLSSVKDFNTIPAHHELISNK